MAASSDKHMSREVRDLRQQGLTAMTWGLPNPVTEATVIGIALLMREKLANKAAKDGATAAAEIAAQVLDKTTSKMPEASQIACKKGCSYCCHSVVSISAPEAFRLARGVKDAAGFRERAKPRHGLSFQQLTSKSLPCPLLVDGDCSAHADRPMGCRQYLATSVEVCKQSFEGKPTPQTFISGAANVGLITRSLLLGAATSLALRSQTYELASALDVALATPDAERRWLAGEDVFASALQAPQPPNMQSSVERWSGMLTALTAG